MLGLLAQAGVLHHQHIQDRQVQAGVHQVIVGVLVQAEVQALILDLLHQAEVVLHIIHLLLQEVQEAVPEDHLPLAGHHHQVEDNVTFKHNKGSAWLPFFIVYF